jgi:hypothetical protein
VNLFVDTSVWSLALRRDAPPDVPQVDLLRAALEGGDPVFTTGLVLQELLQGVNGPRAREPIERRFSTLPFLVPDQADHVRAAAIHSSCRRKGLQVTTIDALLAALCVQHGLLMLSTDQDFERIATIEPLKVWGV